MSAGRVGEGEVEVGVGIAEVEGEGEADRVLEVLIDTDAAGEDLRKRGEEEAPRVGRVVVGLGVGAGPGLGRVDGVGKAEAGLQVRNRAAIRFPLEKGLLRKEKTANAGREVLL